MYTTTHHQTDKGKGSYKHTKYKINTKLENNNDLAKQRISEITGKIQPLK